MRCRHNCFEGHQSDHTFALPGYNECSLGVVITTPSLSANKGSLRPWITHGSWGGGSVGVTHSFPLFLINSRAGTCSQGASPGSRSFTLASFLALFWALLGSLLIKRGMIYLPVRLGLMLNLRVSRSLGRGWLGELEAIPRAIPKAGDICLPPEMTDSSRAGVYFSCWASQWNGHFWCTRQCWENTLFLGTNSKYHLYFYPLFDSIGVCFDWLGLCKIWEAI